MGEVLAYNNMTPVELAEIAEAALALGMTDIGQQVLSAAYDTANGKPTRDLSAVIAKIRQAGLVAGSWVQLSERQFGLLSLARAC